MGLEVYTKEWGTFAVERPAYVMSLGEEKTSRSFSIVRAREMGDFVTTGHNYALSEGGIKSRSAHYDILVWR